MELESFILTWPGKVKDCFLEETEIWVGSSFSGQQEGYSRQDGMPQWKDMEAPMQFSDKFLPIGCGYHLQAEAQNSLCSPSHSLSPPWPS